MSKVCDVCGKGYMNANQVKRGIGDRVTRRSKTRKQPNLVNKKLVINSTPMTVTLCTSCLKRIKFEQKKLEAQNAADVSKKEIAEKTVAEIQEKNLPETEQLIETK